MGLFSRGKKKKELAKMSLGIISIRGDFEPKTAKPQQEVERKIELRDTIRRRNNLNEIRENCKEKKIALDICFYLNKERIEDITRYEKDLDNLMKIVMDVLPDYMDKAEKNEGLGLFKNDNLVYDIHAAKEFVFSKDKEGIEIRLSEYNEKNL